MHTHTIVDAHTCTHIHAHKYIICTYTYLLSCVIFPAHDVIYPGSIVVELQQR